MKNKSVKFNTIKSNEYSLNSVIINIIWVFIGVAMLLSIPFIFLLKQKVSVNDVVLFLGSGTILNAISTISHRFLKNKLFFITKYLISTSFAILLGPILVLVSATDESWVLSFLSLLIFILYMNVRVSIFNASLIFILNVIMAIVLPNKFINDDPSTIQMTIMTRVLSYLMCACVCVYVSAKTRSLFRNIENTQEEIKQERESAVKTIITVREMSEYQKDLSIKNSLISKRLLDSTQNQASSVEESSAAMEELLSSIEEISKTTIDAYKEVSGIVGDVQVGMKAIIKSTEEIEALVKFSRIMIDSIEAINEIAENTNLLALNAAIEAARAGESGKGFAVVASEIRKLAEKSTNAAQNVGNLLKDSELKIKSGSELNMKVNQIFSKISTKIEEVAKVFQQISFATIEIDKGCKEISSGLEVISRTSNENLELSKEIEDSTNRFDKETRKLNQIIKSNKRLDLKTDK